MAHHQRRSLIQVSDLTDKIFQETVERIVRSQNPSVEFLTQTSPELGSNAASRVLSLCDEKRITILTFDRRKKREINPSIRTVEDLHRVFPEGLQMNSKQKAHALDKAPVSVTEQNQSKKPFVDNTVIIATPEVSDLSPVTETAEKNHSEVSKAEPCIETSNGESVSDSLRKAAETLEKIEDERSKRNVIVSSLKAKLADVFLLLQQLERLEESEQER